MSLEQKIMTELKEAMKAKDDASLRALRAIKAAIILAKTETGANGNITEEGENKLLQKLVKQRKDSLLIYEQQHRLDLSKKEQEEIAIIEKFLPAQLNEEQLKEALAKIISETGASSPADVGKIIGIANRQLAGKSNGAAIAAAAKNLLNK